jgi:hypothetical protein
MNDFIASLIAAATFCAAYAGLGLLTRAAILVEWAPSGTAEGSFVQLALAVACGVLARRWLVRLPLRETDTRHA